MKTQKRLPVINIPLQIADSTFLLFFRFFPFRFRLWQQLDPDITSTCWQHLNLASVWNSGRLSADRMNGAKRCLNTSSSFTRTTCVFPPQLRGWNFYVLLLVYSQSCSSPWLRCMFCDRKMSITVSNYVNTLHSLASLHVWLQHSHMFAAVCSSLVFKTQLHC